MDIKKILKISRPRFWIYLLGPYLVGLVAFYPNINNLYSIGAFLLFFTLPANLLVYGVNDIFDYEVDQKNPKKDGYEINVKPEQRYYLYSLIIVLNVPFVILSIFINTAAATSLLCFLFFSIFYSSEPIRAKTIPFLDSLFNILYIFPGFLGFYLAGGAGFNLTIFLAGTCWVMAMHAYSAIPDIETDKKSGIETIATKLGDQNTLYFCLFLYLTSAFLAYFEIGLLGLVFGVIYALLIFYSLYKCKKDQLFKVYRIFPVVNTLVGFIIFLYVLIFT